MHPLKPYFLGARAAAGRPPDDLPEVLPHRRHRQHRPHLPAPHVLRDARQLLDRRLLQAGRRRVRLGVLARGLRLRPRARSGSRSSRATTRSGSAPTRRRSRRGCRSACRASGSSRSGARTTSGRPARPARAGRAPSSTSTAGSSSARRTSCPAPTASASSSTGTSSSCSTTRTPRACSRRCRRRTSTPASGLNRLAAIMQGTTSVFETDQIRPLIDARRGALGPHATARPRRSTARCGSSPTTRAACRS